MNQCHEFLQQLLPKLGYRWPGFRKVRRQVCRRVSQRMHQLRINNYIDYFDYIKQYPEEWNTLDRFLDITISRFWRDRGVFELLEKVVLPDLISEARKERRSKIRCWCAGCCNGEEAYSLQLLWHIRIAPDDLRLNIVATDRNETVLERAQQGRFPEGALKELPPDILQAGFDRKNSFYQIKRQYTEDIRFLQQDIRRDMPAGPFDIILCRNLVFTYFDQQVRNSLTTEILHRLRLGGYLIIGANERLPDENLNVKQIKKGAPVYRKQEID